MSGFGAPEALLRVEFIIWCVVSQIYTYIDIDAGTFVLIAAQDHNVSGRPR